MEAIKKTLKNLFRIVEYKGLTEDNEFHAFEISFSGHFTQGDINYIKEYHTIYTWSLSHRSTHNIITFYFKNETNN